MGKQKIKFRSSRIISAEEDSREISAIAQKRGIKIPSTHLGFFKTVYAKIEEPNLNKIRLAEKAVQDALPGLIGSQVNFEHLGAGFLCGTILDAWINEENEIEVVYSFFKSIYPDEYARSLELASEGKLAVSFELLSERESQEWLSDGTIRLNDIDFQGMGHLMENPPACPEAKIYEFASKCKERLCNIDERELVFASQIEQTCNEILEQDEEINGAKWQTKYINSLPNSSFAVIEPAYLEGKTGDKRARHLPFKDAEGKIDLPHYRNALARVNQIQPITDSISTEELRNKAKKELDKHKDLLAIQIEINDKSEQGGNIKVTEEQIARIKELRVELGDFAKDISDEDLLNDAVIAEIRKEKEAKQAEAISNKENKEIQKDDVEITEKAKEESKEETDAEKAYKETIQREQTTEINDDGKTKTVIETTVVKDVIDWEVKAKELEVKVAELENSLKLKDAEIEKVKANAEKLAILKIQLKDNSFVKEFTDEDYLNEEKVAKAIQDQKNAEIISTRKEQLKDNEYAKDFSDEDYLNDVKVELAKVKKEKDALEAKTESEKETIIASEKEDEEMSTGTVKDKKDAYQEVIASIREENKIKRDTQKVYTRK